MAGTVGERSIHGLAEAGEGAEGGTGWLAWVGEDEGLTGLDTSSATLESDGWEGLDVEVGSRWARGDERRGKGPDGADGQGSLEGVGHSDEVADCADECLMAGLNWQDLAGSDKDGGRLDQGSGSEVGGDTDGLEDAGGGDHVLGSGEVEVVGALLDWLAAGGGDGRCQDVDVGALGATDGLELGDLVLGEAEAHELAVGELGEALVVEGGLEMLEGQGELQDVDIGDVAGGRGSRGGRGGAGGGRGSVGDGGRCLSDLNHSWAGIAELWVGRDGSQRSEDHGDLDELADHVDG